MRDVKVHSKSKGYTILSNYHLRDRSLSLKAKGLLSLVLSLPKEWDYSIAGLVAICKESETAVKSTLDELKEHGYLIVTKYKPDQTSTGRYEYGYDFFEEPHQTLDDSKKQEGEKQGVEILPLEILPLEILAVENIGQLNTNKLNTNNKYKGKSRKADINNVLESIEDESLRESYKAYIEMRKSIKKPMTERALQMLISKVNKLEPNSIERQKQMLENATISNWLSVYPLKGGESGDTRRGIEESAGANERMYRESEWTSGEEWIKQLDT